MNQPVLTDLYDQQYEAVHALHKLCVTPWAIRAVFGSGPTRYYVERDGTRSGPFSEQGALMVAARRNRWLVSHERKVRRQAS